MTDDLVNQLLNSKGWPTLGKAAAARIEALKAERDDLAEKLAKAVATLDETRVVLARLEPIPLPVLAKLLAATRAAIKETPHD